MFYVVWRGGSRIVAVSPSGGAAGGAGAGAQVVHTAPLYICKHTAAACVRKKTYINQRQQVFQAQHDFQLWISNINVY